MENIIKGIKCTIITEIYASGNYRTFGCILNNIADEKNIVLNKYGNFVIAGDIPYLKKGETYTLDLKEVTHRRYGTQYIVDKVKDYEMVENLEELTIDQSKEILTKFTTETQANTLLAVYPNFISMVINGNVDDIDVKKLKNIKEYRLSCYVREINTRFKYYYILIHYKHYDLTVKECQDLDTEYGSVEKVGEAIEETPYTVLIDILHRGFLNADKLLMKIRPELKETSDRIEHIALHILELNEEDDNTYMDANTMAGFCAEIDRDCIKHIKKTCVDSNKIWYDDATKRIAKMDTYMAESTIASFFTNILHDSNNKWDFNWRNYTKIKDGTLTEEQSELLHALCENRIAILNAGAGCVDSETEYFNGKSWKPINQYNSKDKVLQYNMDGTTELVVPKRYIKLPCNEMYHFETQYGLNQTLSEEHIIPYIYEDKNKQQLKFTSMLNLKNNHESNKRGFRGKFITSFKYNGKGINLTDNEIKIMCAVICDGTFTPGRNTTLCRFHIKKDRKKEALRNLFIKSEIEWREKESVAKGYTDFYIYAPRKEKEFLPYWYNCTQHQLQIVCDNILQWDGNVTPTRKRFSTTMLNTANFIQFAFSACGYRASLKENDRRGRIRNVNGKDYFTKSIEYVIIITTRNLLTITKDCRPTHKKQTEIIKVKSTDGFKYCFEVNSGMLVLRRKNNIFITGNCGKTSSMMALISMLEDNSKTYTLLAPTGRAAKRLAEQTHRKASTVHKASAMAQGEGIDSDVIICDEWSMYGLEHMMMIIKACINPDVRFVFSGDIHQLPSIALGCVMKDFIDSEIMPVVTLTKVFRYKDGGLSAVVKDVYDKRPFTNSLKLENNKCVLGVNHDYTFIQADGTVDQIIDTYMEKINSGIKPIDIALITPWNVKEFGTYNINNLIQSAINPARKNEKVITRSYGNNGEVTFRQKDIIMNTKNNYKVPTYEGYKKMMEEIGEVDLSLIREENFVGVFNGDIGRVLEITDQNIMIAQFDENMVVFSRDDCANLVLGYAGTIHKYQGSQCPHVIMLTLKAHEKSYNNNLLYTGLSRASLETTHIAHLSVVNNSIGVDGNENRQTQLKDFIIEYWNDIKDTPLLEGCNNEEFTIAEF